MKNYTISNEAGHTLARFDSFASYVAAAQERNPATHGGGGHFDQSTKWTHYTTLGTARGLLSAGWQEGAERILTIAEKVRQALPAAALEAFKPITIADVTGSVLDVERYLHGDPECFWTEWTPDEGEQVKGKGIVRLTNNLWASSGITPEELMNKGVYVAALADVLETLGYRVQIDGFVACYAEHLNAKGKMTKSTLVIHFPIKSADQPLEIDRLAFVLAHPASLRQVGFHMMDVVGANSRHYGTPAPSGLPSAYKGDIAVDGLAFRSSNDKDTAKAILAQLKELGIDLDLDDLD